MNKVETPEVMPAKRGVGRPSKAMTLVPRTPDQSVGKVAEYHEAAKDHLAKGAVYVVLCGIELCAVRDRVGHGEWLPWVEKNCPFSDETARKYAGAAEAVLPKLSNSNRGWNLAELVDGTCSAGHREALMKALTNELGDMTPRQLFLTTGQIKEEPDLEFGGRAMLIKWLKENYPECKARKADDLPPEIREEWEQHLAQIRAELQAHANRDESILWEKAVSGVVKAVDKGFHLNLPRPVLERTCALLQDLRAQLISQIKKH